MVSLHLETTTQLFSCNWKQQHDGCCNSFLGPHTKKKKKKNKNIYIYIYIYKYIWSEEIVKIIITVGGWSAQKMVRKID